jgi:hypothetical protein
MMIRELDSIQIINAIPALAWAAHPDGSAEFFNQHYLDYAGSVGGAGAGGQGCPELKCGAPATCPPKPEGRRRKRLPRRPSTLAQAGRQIDRHVRSILLAPAERT